MLVSMDFGDCLSPARNIAYTAQSSNPQQIERRRPTKKILKNVIGYIPSQPTKLLDFAHSTLSTSERSFSYVVAPASR